MLAAALIISVAAVDPTAGLGWRTYVNVRYGYEICYPASILPALPEAPNSDGRTFRGKDGAELIVYGHNREEGSGLTEEIGIDADIYRNSGAKVTAERTNGATGLISGTRGDRIFYDRYLSREDQTVEFTFSYPASKRALYDAVVTRLAGCFKLGSAPF